MLEDWGVLWVSKIAWLLVCLSWVLVVVVILMIGTSEISMGESGRGVFLAAMSSLWMGFLFLLLLFLSRMMMDLNSN